MGSSSDKIVCLVGASGSGKTTIAKELSKDYNVIQSYTTRPPREPNEWGHIFMPRTDDATWHSFPHKKEDLIAYTMFDGYEYWAVKDQYQGEGTSIYIITPDAISMLREKVKDADIVVIYVQADECTRCARMDERQVKTGMSWKDISKRIGNDKQAFKVIPCDYAVDNNANLDEAVQAIKQIIEGD